MNLGKIITLTESKLILFVILFSLVHVANLVLVTLIAGTGLSDAGLYVGFPIPFYTIGCGHVPYEYVCDYGLHVTNLLINVLFWYGVTIVIKRNE